MPLFFSISGFLFFKKENKETITTLFSKKTVRLLVPFLLIGLLYMIPIRLLANYLNYNGYLDATIKLITGKDGGHLWFLPSLFIIFIIEYLIMKHIKNRTAQTFLILVLTAIGLVAPLYIGKAFSNTIWFHLGYKIKSYSLTGKRNLSILAFVFFALLVAAYFLIPEDIAYYKYISLAIKMTAATSAIIFSYNIIPNKQIKSLGFIAANSFGIYLLHSPLIYFTYCYLTNLEPSLVLLVNFVLFGTLSLLLTILISKTRLRFMIGLPCQKGKN